MSTSMFWTETTIELPGVREGGMSGRPTPPGRTGPAGSDCHASISCRGSCDPQSRSAWGRAPAKRRSRGPWGTHPHCQSYQAHATLFTALFPLAGLLAALFILPEVYGFDHD